MAGRYSRWPVLLSVALVGLVTSSVDSLAATQFVFEYPIPGAQFNGIVTGADGNLWLTDQGNQSIDQVSFSTGVITPFPIMHPQALPTAITLGADGNVWFLDYNGSYVGKITPAGDMIEYSSTATMLTDAIAAGPDGNIWFGDLSPADIDKITSSGLVTRYPLPIPQGGYTSQPTGIAAGPDGNLWVTDTPNNRILKVTMSGDITPIALPTPTREPLGITAGPDGNLWFGEQGHGRIGRMTTAGVLTEFPINTSNGVTGIAAGPDGNLWFGEAAPVQDMVATMSVAGRYREFPTPTPQARPGRPAAGPDGYMWFPEFAGNIAEVVPPGPWPAVSPWWSSRVVTTPLVPGKIRTWYLTPLRPKSQAVTPQSQARSGSPGQKTWQTTAADNHPYLAPIFPAARRLLLSLESLFG